MRPHPPSSSSSSMVSGEQKEMRDRISQLPDEILIHILCFLPTTKLRAATSILSRRWRHLWACCPSLDLHCKLYAKKSVPGITSKLVLGISYCRFVDHCLRACRAATLARFAVDVGTLFMEANVLTDHDALLNEARHRADRWVRLAAGRSVEELSLRNSWGMPIVKFETPLSVLACARSLTRLKLQYCYFANFPCRAGGFPSLRTLDLSGVIMPDEKLISLLSMCPLLERLSLQCYDYLQGVEVSSSVNPYLKDLKIGGLCRVVIDVPGLTSFQFSGQITLLSLKGAPPRLREAKVYSHQWDHRWRSWTRDDWKKIMSAISHVEILYVNARFFESMVAAASGDGKFEFRDLKVLIWVEDCITESNLNAFFSFVRGCPLLEKLYIVLRHIRSKDRPLYSFDEDAEGEQPPRHQSPPEEPPEEPTNKSSLPRLKSATVIKFSNRRHEMRLVEQLLREAGVLERLQVLQQFRPAKGMEKGKIRKQVCRLPRASPTAHIQYSIMNAAKRRSWKRFWAF